MKVKVDLLFKPYLFIALFFMLAVTVFLPTRAMADWTFDLPSSSVLIKSATVVSSSGSQCTIGGGSSYYNTKYNDTWQIQLAMACIVNGWDCSDKQVPIEIRSDHAMSFEAYVLIGGKRQTPTATGSFKKSGGRLSFTFIINGISWQESQVNFVVTTEHGSTTYALPKTGLSLSI